MSMAQIQTKLVRRIMSPVELLYCLSTHWFVFLLSVLIGSFLVYAEILEEPPVFECHATLVLNQNQVSFDSTNRRPARDADVNFMNEQLSLLRGDSVVDKVVRQLGYAAVLEQEENTRGKEGAGVVQMYYSFAKEKFKEVFSVLEQKPEGTIQEQALQRAKVAFSARSSVTNDRRSNIVKLRVRGTNRSGIERELDAWIIAYRAKIHEMSQDSFQVLFRELSDARRKEVNQTEEDLKAFKSTNKDVSLLRVNSNREHIWQLQQERNQLNTMLTNLAAAGYPGVAAPQPVVGGIGLPPAVQQELDSLKLQKAQIMMELIRLRAALPADSAKVKTKEKELAGVEERVRSLQSPAPLDDGEKETPQQRLEKRLKAVEVAITTAQTDQADMEEKLTQLTVLTEAHKKAQEAVKQLEQMARLKTEQTEALKRVDIQVQDPPVASVHPIGNVRYRRIGIGALAGAGAGFFLAFGLEFFCRRIRFKRDVEMELGLKVVGVIPEH